MTDERDTSTPGPGRCVTATLSHLLWHRGFRLGIVAVAVIASLALLFSYAPRYFARHLVVSALDAQGIKHEGVETLEINPWTRELWLGPVRFGAGPSDRGQLGELGLSLRVNPLL